MSDTHTGHTLGLINPNTMLQLEMPDGSIKKTLPELNEIQKYLWELYETQREELLKFVNGDKLIVFFTGDLCQGNKYVKQLISTDISQQVFMGSGVIEPWLSYKNLIAVRIVMGTAAHNFGEGAAEKIIAAMISSKYPKINIEILYHGLASIGEIDIDYSHHGPFHGSRNWLKGNEARYYLRSIMMDEIQAGNKPPNLVMRGHYHTFIKEYLSITNANHEYESWIVICPSMCLIDEYARQATRSAYRITNGIVAYEIINNRLYTPIKFAETLDVRTKENLL